MNALRLLWASLLAGGLCLAVGCDDEEETAVDAAAQHDEGAAPDEGGAVDQGADGEVSTEEIINGLVASVDQDRIAEDIRFLSQGSRTSPDGANWQAAQDRCADVFLAAGLEVTRQPLVDGGVNVIGVLPGTTRAAEQILVGAHYDSPYGCNGADDNASGTAGVLEAARALGGRRYERTLVFVCFDEEEYGLKGSVDYAARARMRGDDLRGVLVLEMIGYTDNTPNSQRLPNGVDLAFPDVAAAVTARENRGDFLFHIADDTPEMFEYLTASATAAELPLIGVRFDELLRTADLTSNFRRSDHAAFWAEGFPAIMLTDTAEFRNPYYHCALGDDDFETIDAAFARSAVATTVGVLARAAVPAEGEAPTGRVVDAAPVSDPSPLLCDPLAGTCDDGRRCTLVSNNGLSLACNPPTPDGLPLDAECVRDAMGGDTCAQGLFCTLTGRASNATRRCRPLCTTAADCGPGEVCPLFAAVPGVGNCIEGCDPFANDTCMPGTSCGVLEDAMRHEVGTHCLLAGAVPEGGTCGDANNRCAPGLTCQNTLSVGRGLGCLAICRVSENNCNAGRTCRRHADRGLSEDFGYCIPNEALR
ncbi:MAG: M28 family peptidase [Myxococcales bacterium]|nr:M28 family peptidase [Myxococcales bacterium]